MLSKIIFISVVLGSVCCAPMIINQNICREADEIAWISNCAVKKRDHVADDSSKNDHYKSLVRKIELVYNHTSNLELDLDGFDNWQYKFEFLPRVQDSSTEEEIHQHIQIFTAAFHLLEKQQYRYVTGLPELSKKLRTKAKTLLCEMQGNEDIVWADNHIPKEVMDEHMCKFEFDTENYNVLNNMFTLKLFRQYLHELRSFFAKKNI